MSIFSQIHRAIGAAAITGLIAFGASCGGESKTNDQEPSAAAISPAADLSQAETVYTANAGASEINWKGSKLYELDSHTGTIGLKSGQLGFKDGAPVAGKFTLDMTTIVNTDITDPKYNAKLVGHLKNEDFFAVDQFPTATFELVSVAPGASANQYTITGNLTIKEKTRAISAPTTITTDESGTQASAKLTIDRTQFDIRYGSESAFADLAQDKVIDDKVEITLNVALAK